MMQRDDAKVGGIRYDSASPDEAALVQAASAFGFSMQVSSSPSPPVPSRFLCLITLGEKQQGDSVDVASIDNDSFVSHPECLSVQQVRLVSVAHSHRLTSAHGNACPS